MLSIFVHVKDAEHHPHLCVLQYRRKPRLGDEHTVPPKRCATGVSKIEHEKERSGLLESFQGPTRPYFPADLTPRQGTAPLLGTAPGTAPAHSFASTCSTLLTAPHPAST